MLFSSYESVGRGSSPFHRTKKTESTLCSRFSFLRFFVHKRCKKAAAVQKRPLLQTVNPAVKILKFCGIHAKI